MACLWLQRNVLFNIFNFLPMFGWMKSITITWFYLKWMITVSNDKKSKYLFSIITKYHFTMQSIHSKRSQKTEMMASLWLQSNILFVVFKSSPNVWPYKKHHNHMISIKTTDLSFKLSYSKYYFTMYVTNVNLKITGI